MLSEKRIRERLRQVEADKRLHYPRASLFSNSILVVEQVALETEANALRRILEMPRGSYFGEKGGASDGE